MSSRAEALITQAKTRCLSVGTTYRKSLCAEAGFTPATWALCLRTERITCPQCLVVLDWLNENGKLDKVKTFKRYSALTPAGKSKSRPWEHETMCSTNKRAEKRSADVKVVNLLVIASLQFHLADFHRTTTEA